eukprot:3549391-Pleurochrysis_carterae.AAC.1
MRMKAAFARIHTHSIQRVSGSTGVAGDSYKDVRSADHGRRQSNACSKTSSFDEFGNPLMEKLAVDRSKFGTTSSKCLSLTQRHLMPAKAPLGASTGRVWCSPSP